jgi:ubiquinone/menaquinone biosynthesis C-methylase UbiE
MNQINSWTGERLETFVFNDNTVEHLHRYAMVIEFVKDKTVLDIASGEGYGSNLLSKYAAKVFGVDIDKLSIELAKEKYKAQNLEFKIGPADAIPLANGSIDVVVSFETLEHHDKHEEMMGEIKRVLKPGGILIMSTPDKKYYSDESEYKNPFHIKELYRTEFKELISRHFNYSEFYFQKMFNGSLIIPEKINQGFKNFSGDFNELDTTLEWKPIFMIVIASDKEMSLENCISGFNGNVLAAIEKEQLVRKISKDSRDEAINWIKKSWNFRIGKAILSPIRFFKK